MSGTVRALAPLWLGLGAAAGIVALWPGRWPSRVVALGRPVPSSGPHGRVRSPRRDRHRRRRRRERPSQGRGDALQSLDLVAVALSSGAGLHQALVEVAAFVGPSGPLTGAAAKLQRGVALLDVLDALPGELGADWQPVATTLAVTATSGAPAVEAVRRLAAGLRLRRRRRCEQRIRRLPVLLLLPLATLTLPAFVLVTFVPVGVAIGTRAGI